MSKKHLSNKIFEYDEVIDMLSEDLESVDNLKVFCEQHALNYNTVIQVRKNKTKSFPNVVSKLLQIFGYNAKEIKAYKFFEQN